MKTFDWNLLYYETGIPHAERQSFSFDDTGKLSNTGLLGGYQQIIHTDYNKYAVVYECSLYVPFVLNMRADQIHIYTNNANEPLSDADLTAIENVVKPMMPDVWARLQTLDMTNCRAKTIWSQFVALATEPEAYFN